MKTGMGSWIACALLCAALISNGCGGDDVNDAEPMRVPTGGIASGKINGKLNVYVVDGVTDEPIVGAAVLVGDTGETPLEGVTDSTGLITFTNGSLLGGQVITAAAADYRPETWVGANGANVTIPLQAGTLSGVPQAELSGTITGWDTLPTPVSDHYTMAVVGYSQTNRPGAAENELPQPSGTGGLPLNTCLNSQLGSLCDWTIVSRTGSVALYAVILDGDTNGTLTNFDDDTLVVTGFAHKLVTVTDGVDQSAISLDLLDVSYLAEVSLQLENAPAGLSNVAVVLGLDLGADGIMMLPVPFDPENPTMTVPDLDGPFAANANYRAIAAASPAPATDEPNSIIMQREITNLGNPIVLGQWLETAADLTATSSGYTYTSVVEATIHIAELRSGGESVWGIGIFDDRESFTLPTLSSHPLPVGTVEYIVGAIETDANPNDFSLGALEIDRMSNNRMTFER